MSEVAIPGRRERKKTETRVGLHRAAVELVAERGFDDVTIEEICDAADVSPRTFFNYYKCKEDAVLGGPAPGEEGVFEEIMARPANEEPLVAVANVLRAKARQLGERREELMLRFEVVSRSEQLRGREAMRFRSFELRIAEAVAARGGYDLERDFYPSLVAGVAASVLRRAFERWQHTAGRESLVTLVDRSFTSVEQGLPAPPPKRRLRVVHDA